MAGLPSAAAGLCRSLIYDARHIPYFIMKKQKHRAVMLLGHKMKVAEQGSDPKSVSLQSLSLVELENPSMHVGLIATNMCCTSSSFPRRTCIYLPE